MPPIIAHSLLSFPLHAARRLLAGLPSDCPLCGETAAGGRLCPGCAGDIAHSMRGGSPRCARCALRLDAQARHHCPDCARAAPAFARAIAAFDYEPPYDSLIGRYKGERRYGLATALAQLLADAVARQAVPLHRDTVLVPIPSSQASLRRRGFNPAAELAASLAGQLRLPLRRGALRRLREGPRQAAGNRRARRQGAHGLFHCGQPWHGRPVGLVDDVMTTGSTVDAAARALLRAGAADVTVLVAARTPIRDREDGRQDSLGLYRV
ncbi:double zinc ribbon domain-containing protein [Bordetella petrii]|uniref:double zinc ribbon domain-containing protein n=1 Tax=Bordetella petrii TaxID=94624 RepID=UPI001A95BABA|nr:double zinc ribbon domain-containing protein [Bordetella petrii]MBO1112302.1 ComF family protein [Bordetella petrii]